MQALSLQKKKNFNNFVADKLSKKSASYQDDILRTLRRLDEYTILTHQKTRDEIIGYLRDFPEIEKREDETVGWIQAFIDSIATEHKISFKVLQVYLSHIKKYLKYYKIRIDIADEIELPAALLEERYAIPIENIQQIIENSPWKYKGYFLSLVSSGARPGEIMALRKKDYSWTGKHWKALIPAKYTKKKISRTVHFSVETTPYLNKLIKEVEDDDRIWPMNPKIEDSKLTSARLNAGVMFRKQCKKLGFTERYETTKLFKHNMYCFRAYFFTKALRSLTEDKDTAHALIGHGAYLEQYQRRNDEEKEELYEEVEPAVLIYDQTINKEKIKKLKDANLKIEEKGQRIDKLEDQLQSVSDELKNKHSLEPSPEMIEKVLQILKARNSI